MAIQDTYKQNIDQARVGQLANTENKVLISRTNESASNIGFGKPVAQGSDDKGCVLSSAGDTEVVGVTVRERSGLVDGWKQYESVRILREGSIWVNASEVVVAGDPVVVTVDGATFGKTTGAGKLTLANSRWETSAGVGELAVIKIG